MSSFSVLISTSNYRISEMPKSRFDGVKCVVVHQIYGDQRFYSLDIPGHVIYKKLSYPGLSKSRNVALDLCDTSYAYIMDDDVEFFPGKIRELVGLMQRDSIDVATCQFRYKTRGAPKRYKKQPFDHDLLTSAKVASIEMCVNVDAIRKKGIKFDERFGLGTDFPSGEEYIFITDCIKKGLKVRYYPVLTGIHPNETSGEDFFTSSNKVLAKREMIKRVWGWRSPILIAAFWLKKAPLLVKRGYFLSFTKAMILGRL